ncbi:MAG: response regulator transcription factor [Acidobacteriota bacterium]|nr:response regulator transcription factor [Acidobacteriota bacterium]MDE3093812.1 response regulator transcription factor [Acidobacteriota bacterium]MDE3147448.1 response regulator transcription factor [Acidobacteriota bacterium]
MAVARILVVDDEVHLRTLVRPYLEADGYEVLEAGDGPSALASIEHDNIDLAIIDVMLPGFDGIELVKRVRETNDLPIILLTARREEGDRIAGLRLGADDYVTKPFSVPELVARVGANLRRKMTTGDATEEPLVMGDIEVEVGARVVTVKGREVDLTRREFDLLVALMRRPNRVISRTELLNAAWPSTYYVEKTVDVHLAGLRKKLGDALRVSSVRGVGYRLESS